MERLKDEERRPRDFLYLFDEGLIPRMQARWAAENPGIGYTGPAGDDDDIELARSCFVIISHLPELTRRC